jgi:hypothetical protein
VQADVGLKFVTRARSAVDDLLDTLAQRVNGLLDDGFQQALLSECLINDPMAPWSRGGARLVPWRVC